LSDKIENGYWLLFDDYLTMQVEEHNAQDRKKGPRDESGVQYMEE
jgi:hypothetical protein